MLNPSENANQRITLTIADVSHDTWAYYSVDSDLLKPADAWQLRVAIPAGPRPPVVQPGASVRLSLGADTLLIGRIDHIHDDIRRGQPRMLTLTGRDMAAALVDCSAPLYGASQVDLQDIIKAIATPFGITKVRVEQNQGLREKINVEPGDTAWQALQNAAEANGLWPWIEPDGTLVIGGPRYDLPVVATLVLRESGVGNNALAVAEEQDLTHRFSEVTVYGQSHTGSDRPSESGIKATERDSAVPYYRPKIVIDHEVTSSAMAAKRARKLLQDSRLAAYTVKVMVSGHRIEDGNAPGNGILWQPGQRVHLISERHGIDATLFLLARRCSGGRHAPTQTELILKEDGAWITQAHPHARRTKRAKGPTGKAQTLNYGG